ncbi:Crp/Fnr family transcriptional regulator [Apibacter sp.]|uniref:Crp/Fnr family transcriptional regulator n=1 Tax=Apibacter sp. TaxID=2023709 RepID=UPI0025D1D8C6|nr:Crp/Fnr family transcriptional regulator [Apibacter sp.]MCT6868429.1 Crp/Fnr family transcriptional regulator [Apibacter sp.]
MSNIMPKNSVDLIISELKNKEILSKFTKDECNILDKEMKEIRYEKGQEIIHEGYKPTGIYGILSGTGKIYKRGFNGKEQILRFVKKGEIVGYRSLLGGETFSASCTVIDDITAVYIPEIIFHRLLEVSSKVAFDVLKKISQHLGEAGKTITLLAQNTVRERLAVILLFLEKKLDVDHEGFIKINLTREEMANLIGTATESAIRLISEFKNDELIEVEGRRIKIINHQKLSRLGHVVS